MTRAARLPLQPLASRYENLSVLARALGIDRAQLGRWRQSGLLIPTADGLAIQLGFHPAELWPQWFDLAVEGNQAA